MKVIAIDNVQSKEKNLDIKPIVTDNPLIFDTNQILLEHNAKNFNDKETIIVNAFSDFPVISTFSPSKSPTSLFVSTDAADYLKNIPGFVSVRNGGSNADLIFRGMFGSRIRILVDNGEMLGACCTRMDPSIAYIYPGTFDILRLIKGPQTVLLGPVVAGGTLQFERYHPYSDISQIKLHSNIIFGSNNKVDKNIDSIIGNKYGYIRLIGNISNSDDYRDGNKYRVHSAWNKWNADAILSLNLNSNMFFEIDIGRGNGSANYAVQALDGLCFARDRKSVV